MPWKHDGVEHLLNHVTAVWLGMRKWVVAKTQTNREAWASENILRQFAEPYLPKCAERIRVGKHFETRPRLLFRGYVFVRVLDGRWRFLLGTYGVASVIMAGNEPALMPDAEISRLKGYEDGDGLIILPRLGDLEATRFVKGSTVRVVDGLYEGKVGICDGFSTKDRERILLDYLGRKTPVLIGFDQIELVAR